MNSSLVDEFVVSQNLVDSLLSTVDEYGLSRPTQTGSLLSALTNIKTQPSSIFPTSPEYRSTVAGEVVTMSEPTLAATHSFFDVIKARKSRRDHGKSPISRDALLSTIAWTFGRRDMAIAYDWRDAPLRYCSSAGGLCSVDAYCIALNVADLEGGSYYYDYEQGLVSIVSADMRQKVASLVSGMSWLENSAALIVLVAKPERLEHKYGSMGAKLAMLDAGVAVGHLELVATALELRACILGSLPNEVMAELLSLDERHCPIVSLALGGRS